MLKVLNKLNANKFIVNFIDADASLKKRQNICYKIGR